MAVNHEELITQSLEEIDELVKGLDAEDTTLTKSEDLTSEDVSDDAEYSQPEGEEDEAPMGEEGEEEETDEDDEDEDTSKSLEDELNGNESVKKALEVSEFLQELVKGLDTVLSNRTDNISKSISESADESNGLLVKSVQGIARAQKAVLETNADILKSIRSMNNRVKQLESQPVVRKSVSNHAQALEKSFDASLGHPASNSVALTKSQASAKLMAGYEAGNAELLNDILALDGTGNLDSISDAGKVVLGLI